MFQDKEPAIYFKYHMFVCDHVISLIYRKLCSLIVQNLWGMIGAEVQIIPRYCSFATFYNRLL